MQKGRPGKLSELPRTEDNSKISFFVPRRNRGYVDTRKCQRPNFIPRRDTGNTNPLVWRDAYTEQLRDICRIIGRIVDDKLMNDIDWKDDQIFNMISNMVFNSSSKYIPPHI